MMEKTGLETAIHLETAGFAQPGKAFGQMWWIWDERFKPQIKATWKLAMVAEVSENGFYAVCADGSLVNPGDVLRTIFAPTATDILQQLGPEWSLRFSMNRWHCESYSAQIPGVLSFTGHAGHIHDNPHEVCASVWLAINEKSNQKNEQ